MFNWLTKKARYETGLFEVIRFNCYENGVMVFEPYKN